MTADLVPQSEQTPDHDDEDLIIKPGERPPFLVPWCASCGQTVELFTIDPVTSPFRMGVQASCHGATEAIWVSVDDLFARKRLGRPVVLFKKKTGMNSVR